MGTIYIRPIAAAAPVIAIAYLARATVLPGSNLLQMVAAGALIAVLYYSLAYLICLDQAHRSLLETWLRRRSQPASGVY
jgi:hypothetical protein